MPKLASRNSDLISEREPIILKWPGGKSWLAKELSKCLSAELAIGGQYFEPFLGGGSLFFNLRPARAYLSDLNSALIEFYKVVQTDSCRLLDSVWRLRNDHDTYYRVRSSSPRTKLGRASRFLFLNRTCWGGVYRENKKGEFNVPFGYYDRIICRKTVMASCAKTLISAELACTDFEDPLSRANAGDVVYLDPPYTVGFGNSCFRRYNSTVFTWDDHLRLARAARSAAKRGAFVCVSAAYDQNILMAFKGWWYSEAHRANMVSREPASRNTVKEVILFSRKPTGAHLNLFKITNSVLVDP